MSKSMQRFRWFVLATTISGTAAAQQVAPPAPRPAAQPASPAQPVPAAAAPTLQPPPAPPSAPPVQPSPEAAPVAPSEPPPPSPSHRYDGNVGHVMGGMAWNVGIPVGSVHHFTGDVSATGLELLVKYWIHPRVTLGVSVDWQTFADEKPRTTYQLRNGAVTATAYNSVLLGAVRAGGDFYFLEDGPVLPYVGANIGFGWSTLQTSAADIAVYDNQSSVVLGAEGGFVFDPSPRAPKVLLGARYTAEPAVSFLASVHDVQTVVLQLGVMGR